MTKQKNYAGAPPGYVTLKEALRELGWSRQNFYARGLPRGFPIYNAHTVIAREHLDLTKKWLRVRAGLIAVGEISGTFPVNPLDDVRLDIVTKAMDGYYDAICPRCGSRDAVSAGGYTYCEKCGVVAAKEIQHDRQD